MYISADIRAGYKDVCVRGCKHKGGEGGARGRATWKHREGRGGSRVYIRTSRVPRYETHWTTLSLARANSRTVETVCPANWFSLASSIRRNRVHATRRCVHPPPPPPPPAAATRRQAGDRASTDARIQACRIDYPPVGTIVNRPQNWGGIDRSVGRSIGFRDFREIGVGLWIDGMRIRGGFENEINRADEGVMLEMGNAL